MSNINNNYTPQSLIGKIESQSGQDAPQQLRDAVASLGALSVAQVAHGPGNAAPALAAPDVSTRISAALGKNDAKADGIALN